MFLLFCFLFPGVLLTFRHTAALDVTILDVGQCLSSKLDPVGRCHNCSISLLTLIQIVQINIRQQIYSSNIS